jgi:thymidylate kinase
VKKKPALIIIFGIDGCGKTTQAKLLQELLEKEGYSVGYAWSRRELFLLKPFVTFVKRFILREKDRIEGEKHDEITQGRHSFFSHLLIQKAWFWVSLIEYRILLSWRVFRPNKRKDVLVCDRYLPDAIVDIAVNYNCDTEGLQKLLRHSLVRCFPKSTLSFFIDIPGELGAARKSDGTSVDYLRKRVKFYQSAAREVDAVSIDGTKTAEIIAKEIQKITIRKLHERAQ